MDLILKLPSNDAAKAALGPARSHLHILNGHDTAVQRILRREGIAAYEPATQAAILTLLESSGSVFWDVGSHIGFYSALVAALCPMVSVYAFEAAPETARMAQMLRDQNQFGYQITNRAISSQSGVVDLYLSPKAETSNSLNSEFRPGSTAIQVKAVTLDQVIADGAPPPGVIKIDVETHEPDVLLGARNLIETARPAIVSEFLPKTDATLVSDCLNWLEDLGYRFYNPCAPAPWAATRPAELLESRTTTGSDWLMIPCELKDTFYEPFAKWMAAIAECTAQTNVTVEDTGSGPDWLLRT